MLRAGLTGGIACGKSVVAGILRELGCRVLDADALAHRLIEPGQPAYDEVVKEFGFGILRGDGWIDRKILGRIVFADRARLDKLNRIIHPRVIAAREREMVELELADPHGIVVIDAPLLVEAGYAKNLDRLVVAWCRPEQQMERLLARGLSREDAERRIASQMPLEEKMRLADDLIDCSGTVVETRKQVEALVLRLRQLAESEPAEGV
jgi:dephospho-CoA kinase